MFSNLWPPGTPEDNAAETNPLGAAIAAKQGQPGPEVGSKTIMNLLLVFKIIKFNQIQSLLLKQFWSARLTLAFFHYLQASARLHLKLATPM